MTRASSRATAAFDSDARADDGRARARGGRRRENAAELEVTPPIRFDERPPDEGRQAVPNQQVPETVRALVEIRHREIGGHRTPVLRPPPPDRSMREQPLVAELVARGELFGRHVLGLEHDVRGVVEAPVAVNDPPFGYELGEQRRAGVGREDVERGALEAVIFDPLDRALEYAGVVVIEAENEA